jgi:hypothetical protein
MQNTIANQIQQSLDKVRGDLDTLELWLGALQGAAQPLPDYDSPYRRTRVPAKDVDFRRENQAA